MNDEVVIPVALEGELELHVGEHRVRVNPPDPLGLRVGHHRGLNHRILGPIREHLRVQKGIVVKDVVAVEPAVINLVLEESQEEWSPMGFRHGEGCDPVTIRTLSRAPAANEG